MSPHTKVDNLISDGKYDYLSSALLCDGRQCGQVGLRPQQAGDDQRDPGLGRGVQVLTSANHRTVFVSRDLT